MHAGKQMKVKPHKRKQKSKYRFSIDYRALVVANLHMHGKFACSSKESMLEIAKGKLIKPWPSFNPTEVFETFVQFRELTDLLELGKSI